MSHRVHQLFLDTLNLLSLT